MKQRRGTESQGFLSASTQRLGVEEFAGEIEAGWTTQYKTKKCGGKV